MERLLPPASNLEGVEAAPPTFGTRPVVLVLPSDDHVGTIALAIQRSGMVCLLAFDKETLDYWTRHGQYAAFVVDLASSWIKRAAEDLVDRGACVIGLSDDDEERWRAVTRGFKDAFPFSTPAREIAVKLRARTISREAATVNVPDSSGPVTMDLVAHQVQWCGKEVDLSPRLLDLLAYLVSRPRQIVSVPELLEEVWHQAWAHHSKVHKAIGRLREVLGPNSHAHVRSKRGHGYAYYPD